MPTYSKGDVVIVLYPYSDGSGTVSRPAVVVSSNAVNHHSRDVILAQVTSRIDPPLRIGEHVLTDLQSAHLNVPSKVKTGRLISIETSLVRRRIGRLSTGDLAATEQNLRIVFGL